MGLLLWKGYDNVNDLVLDRTQAEVKKNKPKRHDKLLINGNLIYVRNFGSGSICESDVKPNDVRVFLLKVERSLYDDEPHLSLNSSLIRIDTSAFGYLGYNQNAYTKCILSIYSSSLYANI